VFDYDTAGARRGDNDMRTTLQGTLDKRDLERDANEVLADASEKQSESLSLKVAPGHYVSITCETLRQN